MIGTRLFTGVFTAAVLVHDGGSERPHFLTHQNPYAGAGVMSLVEIQGLIKEKDLKLRLLEGAMMKELVFYDQWIGYDDK
ncbi:oviduct-specific glycoprotein [Colletotrichum orchidophilum]|uniref:Oviduct-specific glycoprotein n=1 Tax=Colletotrichum orchidophilum TaxID=1209926 RepID=A0A1G4B9E4_9PEZI|nr:oviduct-specific glycoprotein [Colletotrichum orchidophilum]OHE97902.1 oviduct-specific glycoprotein [Colletotrichum orchidophilum]